MLYKTLFTCQLSEIAPHRTMIHYIYFADAFVQRDLEEKTFWVETVNQQPLDRKTARLSPEPQLPH